MIAEVNKSKKWLNGSVLSLKKVSFSVFKNFKLTMNDILYLLCVMLTFMYWYLE